MGIKVRRTLNCLETYDATNRTFKYTYTRLSRIVCDYTKECWLSQLNMFLGQPVLRELLRKEESSCDVQLFIMGVTRELDDLAAIEEWWRDGVERIGRTDEKNLRKIDRHVNVMILSTIRIVSRTMMSGYVKGRTLKARFCSRSSTSSRAAEGSP